MFQPLKTDGVILCVTCSSVPFVVLVGCSYFLFHMSFSRFVAGVSAMFSDGSHSDTFASKLRGLLAIFMIFFPYFSAAAHFVHLFYGNF